MTEFKFPPLKLTSLWREHISALRSDDPPCCVQGTPDQDGGDVLALLNGGAVVRCDSSMVYETNPDLDYTADGEALKSIIFFPKVNGQPQPGPVVVICHGNRGQLQTTYDNVYKLAFVYLMRCLAANGFVAVSVKVLASSTTPAPKIATLKKHLENLVTEVKKQKSVDLSKQPLALIGHSQGGQAVRSVAASIKKGELAAYKKVHAVVCLGTFYDDSLPVGSDFSDAVLFMHGVFDGDMRAGQGIRAYNALTGETPAFKGFVWIHGGNHSGFADSNVALSLNDGFLWADSDWGRMLRPVTVNWLTQVYVIAFIAWRLKGAGEYAPLVRGDVLPSLSSLPPGAEIDKNRINLVNPLVRHGSNSEIPFSKVGPAVWFSTKDFIAEVVYAPLANLCNTTLHTQKGFRLKWDTSTPKKAPGINFILKTELLPHPLSAKYVCIECIRVVDSTLNNWFFSCPVKVILSSKPFSFASVVVNVQNSQPTVQKDNGKTLSKTVLSSIRIRLDTIPGATPAFLSMLTAVSLSFSGSAKGDVLVGEPYFSIV